MINAAAIKFAKRRGNHHFMVAAARRLFVFMVVALRRNCGGDLIRHGARRPEAGTPIYKYIGIGRGVTQAPLPLPLTFINAQVE